MFEYIISIKKSLLPNDKRDFFMVPVVGVEPTRYRYHWILSPARLPIPSHRQLSDAKYYNKNK